MENKLCKGQISGSKLDPRPIGWKARIALLVPSFEAGLTTYEYLAMFPEGVALTMTKMFLEEATAEGLAKMSEDAIYGAKLCGTAKVDVVSYCCTSGAMVRGEAWEDELLKKIAEASGAKACSMAYAVVEALKFLRCHKLVVAAPYTLEVIEREKKYLEDQGFEILYLGEPLGLSHAEEAAERSPWLNYQWALKIWNDAMAQRLEADALLLTCGGMRYTEIIEALEARLGKPVVASNQANAWKCLQLAGVKEPLYGFGKLLELPR